VLGDFALKDRQADLISAQEFRSPLFVLPLYFFVVAWASRSSPFGLLLCEYMSNRSRFRLWLFSPTKIQRRLENESMNDEVLELEHAKTFMDVILGVVIAFPLSTLPILLNDLITTPDAIRAVNLLLSTSGLILIAFYWVEANNFIAIQKKFDTVIGVIVPLPLLTFFLGGLLAIAFASAILIFAKIDTFRQYLIANVLFWVADIIASYELKRIYGAYHGNVEGEIQLEKSKVAGALFTPSKEIYWFAGHIQSQFFYLYGAVNAALFLLILAGDYLYKNSIDYRFIAAIAVLLSTLFRHLFWRSKIYRKWTNRKFREG
jgi:hypothetical protein